MRVEDILKYKANHVITVTPDTTLSECVVLMSDRDLGSLVVVDAGRLVGLLTFREVINVLAKRQREFRSGPTPTFMQITVRQVMTPEPMVTDSTMDVAELRSLMVSHRQRYLPVVDGDRLRGIISFHDVAKAVHEEQAFENRMLKEYIRDWPVEEHAVY